jgi:hypothetical protein
MWDAPLLALFQKWEYDSLQRKFFEVEVLSITLKQFFRHDSASFSLKIALCPIQSVTTEVVICISSPAVATQRQPLLGTTRRRDLFLTVFEQVRQRYQFVVVGYVVMPEHIHLLISEPAKRNPSTVMQV